MRFIYSFLVVVYFTLSPLYIGFAQNVIPDGGGVKILESSQGINQGAAFFQKEDDIPYIISDELFDAASLEERSLFGQAKAYFDQGNYEIARSSFETLLLNYPESPLLPDVYILLSEVYRGRGELNRAAELLNVFLGQFPDEPRVGGVRLRLSSVYFSLGDLKKVIALWEGKEINVAPKVIVFDELIKTYAVRGKYLEALRIMMKKKSLVSDSIDNTFVQQEIIGLIQGQLQEEALQSVVREFGIVFPADEAMIRLISLYDVKGDYHHEEKELIRFLSQFPSHRFVSQARHLLSRIKDKIKANRYLIAVILPLSGRLASFGNNALNGAELAVQLFKEDFPGASVGLVVRDLEADPSRLRETLEGWINKYHPVAVVGPLLSKEVNRVAPIVQKADIFLITPGATSHRLFSLGTSVFRNAVTNRFLCNAIAEYAVLQLEVERFAVLFPDEQLGRRWVDCFSQGVEKLGGEVVLTERYPLNDSDFSRTILRLKKADLAQDGFIDEVRNEAGKIEEVYVPGFEAIFLPADAVRAGLIIPQLLFHEFGDVNVLGTNSWNSSEFLRVAGPYAEEVVLVDGFFKESLDPVVQTFVKQFRTRFKKEPDLFAAQTYDATRLILSALKAGALTSQQLKTAVAETVDFPGASGFIYEVLDGEMIKEPFFIQVEDGKFVQVNYGSAD